MYPCHALIQPTPRNAPTRHDETELSLLASVSISSVLFVRVYCFVYYCFYCSHVKLVSATFSAIHALAFSKSLLQAFSAILAALGREIREKGGGEFKNKTRKNESRTRLG